MENSMVINSTTHTSYAGMFMPHLLQRVSERKLNFFSPFNLVSTEVVQVSYMMSEILNQFETNINYHSFFCNSTIEGLHGAIKLARHYLYTKFESYDGNVDILDFSGRYKYDFNQNTDRDLLPGINLFSSESSFLDSKTLDPSIRVFSFNEAEELDEFNLDTIVGDQNSINILDLTFSGDIRIKHKIEQLAFFDLFVWSESLSNNIFPFGAFSSKPEYYKPWQTINNYGLHSTTYGGNPMVLSYVKSKLLEQYPIFKTSKKYTFQLDQIEKYKETKLKCIFKHLNIFALLPLYLINPKLNFQSSNGPYLYTENVSKGQILDCVGSSGCNAIGHNNQGFLDRVLKSYSGGHEYTTKLRQQLQEYTGLGHIIQGVSGASVVEIALRLALLAQPKRKRILIVRGNFSGKTLLAMSVTDGVKHIFGPIYDNITIFDTNQKNAKEKLLDTLSQQNIGLVWMEYIQGRSFKKIDDELLEIILKNRKRYKYFIGIDEILNGGLRTGCLTSFKNKIHPEIMTFSKAFSGMMIPNAFLAVSDEVYLACSKQDPNYTNALSQKYSSEFRACVALEYFKLSEDLDIKKNVKKNSDILISKWEEIQENVRYVRKLEVRGLHINIQIHDHIFPFNIIKGSMRNDVVSYLFYKRANIFCIYTRLLPPLNISNDESNFLIKGIEKALSVNAIYIIWVFLRMKLLKRWYVFKYCK